MTAVMTSTKHLQTVIMAAPRHPSLTGINRQSIIAGNTRIKRSIDSGN